MNKRAQRFPLACTYLQEDSHDDCLLSGQIQGHNKGAATCLSFFLRVRAGVGCMYLQSSFCVRATEHLAGRRMPSNHSAGMLLAALVCVANASRCHTLGGTTAVCELRACAASECACVRSRGALAAACFCSGMHVYNSHAVIHMMGCVWD